MVVDFSPFELKERMACGHENGRHMGVTPGSEEVEKGSVPLKCVWPVA